MALKTLYKEGGVVRFYRGVGPALIQGPMSRFGDTAANAGVLTLLDESESTRNLPIPVKTACASAAAGAFRIFLMPVDALKTTMQVEGKNGFSILAAKVRTGGVPVLYHGALAAAAATWAGHFPWCAVGRRCGGIAARFNAASVHSPVLNPAFRLSPRPQVCDVQLPERSPAPVHRAPEEAAPLRRDWLLRQRHFRCVAGGGAAVPLFVKGSDPGMSLFVLMLTILLFLLSTPLQTRCPTPSAWSRPPSRPPRSP